MTAAEQIKFLDAVSVDLRVISTWAEAGVPHSKEEALQLEHYANTLEQERWPFWSKPVKKCIVALRDAAVWIRQATKPDKSRAAYWKQLAEELHSALAKP
jgi:hypothetical protein